MPAEKKEKKRKTEIEQPIFRGVFMFPNGDKYDGEYQQSIEDSGIVRSGQGEHYSNDGTYYVGQWGNDKMNGHGKVIHPSGASYEGAFKDNMMHGHGKYHWPNGSMYEGPFHQNRMEGTGKFCDTKGQVWTGQFSNKAAVGLRFQLNM